jgi:hypothetical protein
MFPAQLTNSASLPPLPEGPDLERVRGPVELSTLAPWQIVLLVLIPLILILLLVVFWRRRPRPETKLPAFSQAMQQIDAARKCIDSEGAHYAGLASAALRAYLESKLQLGFSSRTSEEFLDGLRAQNRLPEVTEQKLTEVLATCDRLKFAPSTVPAQKRRELDKRLTAVIAEVEEQCAQPEETA